jgi:hypothetical protein
MRVSGFVTLTVYDRFRADTYRSWCPLILIAAVRGEDWNRPDPDLHRGTVKVIVAAIMAFLALNTVLRLELFYLANGFTGQSL